MERLIRGIRAEYLDQLFYWNAEDLERKLGVFKNYFNAVRAHQGLGETLRRRTQRNRHRRWLTWPVTLGKATATAQFSSQLLPDHQFAMFRQNTGLFPKSGRPS